MIAIIAAVTSSGKRLNVPLPHAQYINTPRAPMLGNLKADRWQVNQPVAARRSAFAASEESRAPHRIAPCSGTGLDDAHIRFADLPKSRALMPRLTAGFAPREGRCCFDKPSEDRSLLE
jgi:hypothetical protein